MNRVLAMLAVAACSSPAPIEVVERPSPEVVVESLPSTLACGTTAPALSLLYVGNHNTLQTACQGDGPTLILLHVGDEYPWREKMAELAPRYRVIAPDLRGYDLGATERLDEYLQDIVMLIRKTSTGPVIVVGHEAGTALADALAKRHPELVAETQSGCDLCW